MKRIYLLVIIILLLSCSNGKKSNENYNNYIELFDTFSPKEMNHWVITKFDSLKLRETPEEESMIVNHLPIGSVLEVIKKENNLKEFMNIKDYWYFVNYKGEKGWIFGYYLEIFNSYEEAVKRSEEILFGNKEVKSE